MEPKILIPEKDDCYSVISVDKKDIESAFGAVAGTSRDSGYSNRLMNELKTDEKLDAGKFADSDIICPVGIQLARNQTFIDGFRIFVDKVYGFADENSLGHALIDNLDFSYSFGLSDVRGLAKLLFEKC